MMLKNIKNRTNKNMAKNINKTLNNIINQNKTSKKNKNNDNDENCINQQISFRSLSSNIVNEIGSYLHIYDLFKFEQTNQRIFVALRYPFPALKV